MDKATLRSKVLLERKKLSQIAVEEKSSKIVDCIFKHQLFSSSVNIACYYPFKNEVNLLPLLKFPGKNILFPKVVKGTRKLDFHIVESLIDFKKGTFGVMEPHTTLPKIRINDIDLFLIPGVAFSRFGERIGYGGGYYDSTLQFRKRHSFIAGVCFAMQVIPSGFADKWDEKANALITETEIIII